MCYNLDMVADSAIPDSAIRRIHALGRAFVYDETGATALEYTLIATVVAILALSGLVVFANSNTNLYSTITSTVTGVP